MGKYHTPHHATWLENWHFEWFPGEADFFNLGAPFDEGEHEVIHLGHRKERGVILSGRYPDSGTGRTPQTYLTDRALDWLGMFAHVRRPFLMRVSYLAPHTPVLAPEPFYSMYDPAAMDWDVPGEEVLASRPRFELPRPGFGPYHTHTDAEYRRMRCTYYGLVSHIDQQVGRLLDGLDSLGLRDSTLVVYTSDHGDLIGEYGQFQKGQFYDITTRVPCVLCGPGVPRGIQVEDLTETVDLGPTLLGLAGLQVPAAMVGRDMLRQPRRDDVIGEICRSRNGHVLRRSWIRTVRWSLDLTTQVDNRPSAPFERDGKLVDLIEDPLAHRNLFDDPAYADVTLQLSGRLADRTSSDRRPAQRGGPPEWLRR
jgi:choline-sulfatase